jgi:hypothetical protein
VRGLYLNTSGRIVQEIRSRSRPSEKPNIADIYAAGSILGLNKNDIARLHRGDTSSRLSTILARHQWVLLPIAVAIAVAVLFFVYVLAGSPPLNPTSSYPSGTRYGVLKKVDFRKKFSSLLRTG